MFLWVASADIACLSVDDANGASTCFESKWFALCTLQPSMLIIDMCIVPSTINDMCHVYMSPDIHDTYHV